MGRPLRILCLGGCNLRQPIQSGGHPGEYQFAGPPFFTYGLGEMTQALACYRGDRTIPRNFLRLCNMRPDTEPTPAASPLGSLDVALVEPNTSVEIVLDGIYINRAPIWRLLKPLRQLGPTAVKALVRWYEKGLSGLDPAARREAAGELIPLIPPDWPRAGLMTRVLRHAESATPPLAGPMERLVADLGVPVGVVLFNWAYMPDGRPLSWPAGFRGEVVAAAERLGLPVFDPADHIRRASVAVALESDLRHYTPAFYRVIAGPLIEFAFGARDRGQAIQPATAKIPAVSESL